MLRILIHRKPLLTLLLPPARNQPILEHPSKQRKKNGNQHQLHMLSDRKPILLLRPTVLGGIPLVANLSEQGWVVGEHGVDAVPDCPAHVFGFVDCPAEYQPVAGVCVVDEVVA